MVEIARWVPSIGLSYAVGIDGLSIWMLLLTTFLFPVSILASWTITKDVRRYLAAILVLETAVIGTFVALDLLLFFLFFEALLVPMYLLIGGWGGQRRIYAAIKFFLFTMAGSAFLLVAILFLYAQQDGPRLFGYGAMMDAAAGVPGHHGPVALPRVLRRVRGEGAAGAAAHLAARRAHRGADGRLGAARGAPVEGRDVRADPLQPDAVPGGVEVLRDVRRRDRRDRDRLRGGERADPDRHQAAGGVLLRLAPRLRRAGRVRVHAARGHRRRAPDGEPRPRHRRPVPARRDGLRADAHPRPGRAWAGSPR